MYELNISVHYSKSHIIKKIAKLIEDFIKSNNGIIICSLIDNKSTLSIAINKEHEKDIKNKMLEILPELIVSEYKYEYLNNHITENLINAIDRITLINALTMFDKQTDIDLVKKNLVIDNNIVIDSLYHFKLIELKNRWQDIVDLISQNLINLIAGDCLKDMLKFLIASSPAKTENIYISDNDNKIKLFNNDINISIDKKYKNYEEKIISKLINLCPKNIYITNDVYTQYDMSKKIEDLFEGRVFVTS